MINLDPPQDINNFNKLFSNKEQTIYDFPNYCFNNNNAFKLNNASNLYNNISQHNQNYSYLNNNINNNFTNDNSIIYNNTNNNILNNNINPIINNYNIYNHNNFILNNNINNCNNIFPQTNNYNNIINSNYNNLFNCNNFNQIICKNEINAINTKNINNINNIDNNNNISNRIKYLNLIKNNLIENNLNNKIFININNNKKKNGNIKNNNIYENISEQIYLDEFIKYVNSLPMPLVNYLCTSKGILEIQKKIPKLNYDYKLFIMLHLNKDGLKRIMKNTYGNYFFQQIIKDSEEKIISLILAYISDDFISISKDSSGTFSLQALLEEISTLEQEEAILKCINNHELEMAYDKNATHVLKKLLLLFPDNHRKKLNEIILNNIINLCLDSNGICLIKNFIRTNTIINDKNRINDEFANNLIILAESPYGNYGIQYLMENWEKNVLNDIKNKITENICKLSMQQYSSNVVEKAIEVFDGEFRENLIKKLCFEENFITLLKNKFGRFVLYKAVNYMNNELKGEFENELTNKINSKAYNNKDKNKIKRFLIKIKSKNNENNYNTNNNNFLFINNKNIIKKY